MSTLVVSIPVPSSGFGPAVDVSSMVGEKTVVLSGRFRGAYVLYGSHQSGPGARFAPLLIFNAGGIEGVKQTFKVSLAQVKLKSLASGAAGVSANISGLSVPGDNSFTSVGVGGVLDLGSDAFQVDLNFMGFGVVNGAVVVEGSLDGMSFNPLGNFSSSLASPSLLGGGAGIEFSPIVCSDRIRYVRLNVQGSATSGFVVTVGGAVSEGGGGAGTLAATYDVGSSTSDQTMTLDNARGGNVVFDASGAGFTGADAVQVLVLGGLGAGFLSGGGMELGPDAINIQEAGWPANTVGSDGIAMGGWVVAGDSAVCIGLRAEAPGYTSVSVGPSATSGPGDYNTAIGPSAKILGVGTNNTCVGFAAVVGDPSLPIETRDFSGNVYVGGGDGVYATLSVAMGNNVLMGSTTDSEIMDSCIAMGNSPRVGGTVGGVPLNNGIAIGNQARIVNIVDVMGNSGTASDAIAMGTGANTNEAGSIVVGNGASISFIQSAGVDATGDIAIGDGAVVDSYYGGVVVIGQNSQASGDSCVVIGDGSSASGDGNVVIGKNSQGGLGARNGVILGNSCVSAASTNNSLVIGDSSSANSEESIVVGFYSQGGVGGGAGQHVIAMGSYAITTGADSIAIGRAANALGDGTNDSFASVVIGYAASSSSASKHSIAIGDHAASIGDYGMAFGSNAIAGANEVVFGSAHNVSKFRAVSGLAANADLFTFDQSLVGSPDTTSMMLLIQKHSGGAIASVPVTLSTIDVYGNSYLQVANT